MCVLFKYFFQIIAFVIKINSNFDFNSIFDDYIISNVNLLNVEQ